MASWASARSSSRLCRWLAIRRDIEHRREVGFDLGLFTVADGLDQQFAQRLALELEFAEHVEDLTAERLARLFELFQQLAVDVAFAGFVGDQVPQVAGLGLADPVDTAEALFEPVGVPRQVVIDHQVRALQVDALAGGVGRQQYLHLGVVLEGFLHLEALFPADAAMDDDDCLLAAEQRGDALLQVVERVAVLGEDDQLLVG
jgi:hypothetical protein